MRNKDKMGSSKAIERGSNFHKTVLSGDVAPFQKDDIVGCGLESRGRPNDFWIVESCTWEPHRTDTGWRVEARNTSNGKTIDGCASWLFNFDEDELETEMIEVEKDFLKDAMQALGAAKENSVELLNNYENDVDVAIMLPTKRERAIIKMFNREIENQNILMEYIEELGVIDNE